MLFKRYATSLAGTIENSPSLMLALSNLSRAASLVVPIPLLYLHFGAAEVAFWLVVTTLVSLQNLFLLSLPHVLVRALAYADSGGGRLNVSVNDRQRIGTSSRETALAELCQFIRVAFTVISTVLLILLATAGTAVVFRQIEQLTDAQDGWLAWATVAAFSLARVHLLRQLTFLNGMGDVAWPRAVDAAAWSSGGVLAGVVLWLTGSLLGMAFAACLPAIVATILLSARCNRLGWKRYSSGATATRFRAVARTIWQPMWRSGLGVFLSTGARQGTGLLFAQIGTSEHVAGYLLAQNVASVILMLGAAPVQARLHAMARARATGDVTTQLTLAKTALEHSLWVVAAFCGGIGLVAIPILNLVEAESVFVPLEMWLVMGLTILLHRYGAAHLQSYSVTNHIIWHWLDGITGLLNLTITLALVGRLGAWGVVIGYFSSVALFYFWVPSVYAHRAFALRWPADDLQATAKPAATFLVLSILALVAVSASRGWAG